MLMMPMPPTTSDIEQESVEIEKETPSEDSAVIDRAEPR